MSKTPDEVEKILQKISNNALSDHEKTGLEPYDVLTIEEAKSALLSLALSCLPEKMLNTKEESSNDLEDYIKGYNQAIDQTETKLQEVFK